MNKFQYEKKIRFVGTGSWFTPYVRTNISTRILTILLIFSDPIIHNLLLILLHALQHSPLHFPCYSAADFIIQDCFFGTDVLFPHCVGGSTLVITPRLVMDYIGGDGQHRERPLPSSTLEPDGNTTPRTTHE